MSKRTDQLVCGRYTLHFRIISENCLLGEIVCLEPDGVVSHEIGGIIQHHNKVSSKVAITINWDSNSFTILSGYLFFEGQSVRFNGMAYCNYDNSTIELSLSGQSKNNELRFEVESDAMSFSPQKADKSLIL